jgi:hypothetical protein
MNLLPLLTLLVNIHAVLLPSYVLFRLLYAWTTPRWDALVGWHDPGAGPPRVNPDAPGVPPDPAAGPRRTRTAKVPVFFRVLLRHVLGDALVLLHSMWRQSGRVLEYAIFALILVYSGHSGTSGG